MPVSNPQVPMTVFFQSAAPTPDTLEFKTGLTEKLEKGEYPEQVETFAPGDAYMTSSSVITYPLIWLHDYLEDKGKPVNFVHTCSDDKSTDTTYFKNVSG